MEVSQLEKLIERYLAGACNPEEQQLLELWYARLNMGERIPLSEQQLLNAEALMREALITRPGRRKQRWLAVRVAAACLVGLTLVIGSVYFFSSHHRVKNEVVDIPPGRSQAVLTLANGNNIVLDSSAKGQIATQAGTKILKLDNGEINYQSNKSFRGRAASTAYNTLMVPKGGVFKIVLPDGSSVWMNSASVLKYPASFVGKKTREVYLSGEAYFEIFHDKLHPFIVKSDKQQTRVLGTHFNINTYPDNAVSKTTLMEGSVIVKNLLSKDSCMLTPGKQAVLDEGIKVKEVDVDAAMDWKDGYFIFDREPLGDVLVRLSRWYNIEVIYKSNLKTVKLNGIISRNTPLSEVLSVLTSIGKVHFEVKGRKVYVIK